MKKKCLRCGHCGKRLTKEQEKLAYMLGADIVLCKKCTKIEKEIRELRN